MKNLAVNCGNLSHWSIDENREERLVILGWPLPCHPLKRQLVFDCHERNPYNSLARFTIDVLNG